MAAPSLPTEDKEPLPYAVPVLAGWLRAGLIAVALALIVVFTIAACLNPYTEAGTARTMETHRQLGLPPCTFKVITGLPCPSCGMTTSFSLLMHGDVVHSLWANPVGTLLAVFCLALIPWSVASAYLGRPLFILSVEVALMRVLIVLIGLMVVRWVIVLIWIWWSRT
jgi:Protein of unknown function (DUF2752)